MLGEEEGSVGRERGLVVKTYATCNRAAKPN
jgi:hypothetical protein